LIASVAMQRPAAPCSSFAYDCRARPPDHLTGFVTRWQPTSSALRSSAGRGP
jgi:hypothetical protein